MVIMELNTIKETVYVPLMIGLTFGSRAPHDLDCCNIVKTVYHQQVSHIKCSEFCSHRQGFKYLIYT
jgi:hypothetical protein